jgi:hypothetical protein
VKMPLQSEAEEPGTLWGKALPLADGPKEQPIYKPNQRRAGFGFPVIIYYAYYMDIAAIIKPAAEIFGLSIEDTISALEERREKLARETTGRATGEPRPARLKWETDRRADEDPATFAWRAYAAEAKAGTLHRGVIYSEDRELHRRLNSWLRTYDMPEGIDIPTLPEWNARQVGNLSKLREGLRGDPKMQEVRRLEAVARRRRRALVAAP